MSAATRPYKSAASYNADWIYSGSGKGSYKAGTGAPVNSEGGQYLNPGKSDTSAFNFIKPRVGGRFNTIKWNTSKSPRFRVVLKPMTVNQGRIIVGLYSGSQAPKRFDTSTKSVSNRVELFLHSSSPAWRVHVCKSTTSSSAWISGAPAAAATVQDIEIRVSSSRIVTIYMDSTLVYTSSFALAANKNLIPMIGIQNSKAVSTTKLGVYHVEMSQDITA
jgi:hypothetical protein